MVILALVLAALGTALPSGFADHNGLGHVVCVRVWYESPSGSPPHDVVNECRVGGTWVPDIDESHCEIFEQPTNISICYWYQISTP